MSFAPSLPGAALAGAFSGFALPFVDAQFGGGSGLGIGYVLAFLAVVAFPAHVFVVGLRPPAAGERPLWDKPLFVRAMVWLAAAALATAVPMFVQGA